MIEASSLDSTERLSNPRNRTDAEGNEWFGVPRQSPSSGSGDSTCPSTPMVDVAVVPFPRSEGSDAASEISALTPSKDDINHSSPPSVLVSVKLSGFKRSFLFLSCINYPSHLVTKQFLVY